MGDLVQGNTPKLRWNRGGVRSTKTCNISETWKLWPRSLWRTNRKSHMCFWLVPKSMTLDDLERPKRTLAEKKFIVDRPILSAENVSQW